MNAYELADILQEYYDDFDGSFPALEKSIVMLRQQAQAIATLSDRIAELEKSQMAWYEAGKFVSPQIKELSDEEIQSIWNEGIVGWYATQEESVLKFARAILKKASEK